MLAKMDPIYPQLQTIFCYLDVHASIFSLDRFPVLRLASQNHILGLSNVITKPFSKISDIEKALITLQNWKTNHLMATVSLKGFHIQELPHDVSRERLQLESQFRLFESAIEAFRMNNDGQTLNRTDRQRIMLLHCQALIFHGVLLENITFSDEDTKTPMEAYCKFDFALEQIAFLISDSDAAKMARSDCREFTVSTNVIAMLYFVCLKTRSKVLLEKSLAMMNNSPIAARDGLWDSRKAYLVVRSLISEEDHDDTPQEMDIRLEDVGADVINTTGGLDNVFRALRIEESAN